MKKLQTLILPAAFQSLLFVCEGAGGGGGAGGNVGWVGGGGGGRGRGGEEGGRGREGGRRRITAQSRPVLLLIPHYPPLPLSKPHPAITVIPVLLLDLFNAEVSPREVLYGTTVSHKPQSFHDK